MRSANGHEKELSMVAWTILIVLAALAILTEIDVRMKRAKQEPSSS